MFRTAVLSVAAQERDAWFDLVLGLGELPPDGPDLPRGCVPYLPCSVDALVRLVDEAPVQECDVFVDVGSGVGRAAAFVHLLTGAVAIGIEVQRDLVRASRATSTRVPGVWTIEGDAQKVAGFSTIGSVFFLYCPFSGPRLASLLDTLEPIARARMLRIGCVDVTLPPRSWLTLAPTSSADLAIYRTTLHDDARAGDDTGARSAPREEPPTLEF